MKTTLKISAILLLFLAFAACKNKVEGTKATTGEAKTAPATNTSSSTTYRMNSGTLKWVGPKAIGNSHQGTITLTNGNLAVAGEQIKGGDFEIDMGSIAVTDLEAGKGKEKLEGHLKNEDFSNVGEFPKGLFKIVQVTPVSGVQDATHNVTGNLTLKGIEKSITFPASIAVMGDKLSAVSPSFTINRTDWGIKYGSSGSFADLQRIELLMMILP